MKTEISKQTLNALRFLFCSLVCFFALTPAIAQQPFDAARGVILRGTVVTMDEAGTILHKGIVLVRNGKIVATWEGPQPPHGTPIGDAVEIDLGPKALIFPGLINLHNHPTYSMLNLWAAPSRTFSPVWAGRSEQSLMLTGINGILSRAHHRLNFADLLTVHICC